MRALANTFLISEEKLIASGKKTSMMRGMPEHLPSSDEGSPKSNNDLFTRRMSIQLVIAGLAGVTAGLILRQCAPDQVPQGGEEEQEMDPESERRYEEECQRRNEQDPQKMTLKKMAGMNMWEHLDEEIWFGSKVLLFHCSEKGALELSCNGKRYQLSNCFMRLAVNRNAATASVSTGNDPVLELQIPGLGQRFVSYEAFDECLSCIQRRQLQKRITIGIVYKTSEGEGVQHVEIEETQPPG